MPNPFNSGSKESLPTNLPPQYHRGWFKRLVSHAKQKFLPGIYDPLDTGRWSKFLQRKRHVVPDTRKKFLSKLQVPDRDPPVRHSHPIACLQRNAASAAIVKAVEAMGKRVYNVSKSSSDRVDGNRFYYVSKDLKLPYHRDTLDDDHCYVMVDVDYYVDLPEYLRTGRPIAMYTVVPPAIAGVSGEHKWWFEGNTFVHEVSGGARYQHRLWDHCNDVVTVVDKYGNLLVYEVLQVAIPGDDLHRIVYYAPQAVVKDPYWRRLDQHELRRLEVAFGDAHLLRVPAAGRYSVSLAGTSVSVEVEDRYLLAAQLRYKEMRNPTIGELQRYLQQHVKDPDVTVPIIWCLLKAGFEVAQVRRVPDTYLYEPGAKPKSYIALEKGTSLEDGKESGIVVGPPLVVEEAIVPREAVANQLRTVHDRVTAVANKVEPPREYDKLAQEFVRLCLPVANLGAPVSYDEVFENQNRPAQVARSNLTFGTLGAQGDNITVSAFQKKETYPSAKSARNISQVPTDHLLRLSCFTYAMKKDLKSHSWYGAASGPSEVLRKLRDIADMSPEGVVCKDYSKFDGTISQWLYRRVARACAARWCQEGHRAEFCALLDAEQQVKARTTDGVTYNTGSSRLSGSPVTSDHNTIINAFVSYAALRAKYSSRGAWARMGLYCGDDGVDVWDINPSIKDVSTKLGLSVKLAVHKRGSPVDYCGRYFVDPWTLTDSFADPIRTMRKLHISFSAEPLAIARSNRAAGYLATDSLTPIVGPYCRKMDQGLTDEGKMIKSERLRYSNAWPQENPGLILDAFCAVSGLSHATVEAVESAINRAVSIDAVPPRLLTFPVSHEPGYLVGEVIEPPQAIVSLTTVQNNGTSKSSATETATTTSVATDPTSKDAETDPAARADAAHQPHTNTAASGRPERKRRHRRRPQGVLGNAQREDPRSSNTRSAPVQSGELRDVYARPNGRSVQRLRRPGGHNRGRRNRGHIRDICPQVVSGLQARQDAPGRDNHHATRPQLLPGGLASHVNPPGQAAVDASHDVCHQRGSGRGGFRRVPIRRPPRRFDR